MPFCNVSKDHSGGSAERNNGVKIFYKTHGHGQSKLSLVLFLSLSLSFKKKKQFIFTGLTTIMAKDAIALMDHLGGRKAHVFGHSMGEFRNLRAMIACKLAAIVPDRILSLALLNVTGGDSIMIRFIIGNATHKLAMLQNFQVNQSLLELIKASEMKLSPHDWSNLPRKGSVM
ncbi:hypothetical protein HHK36_013545 [Tetracentron sinense]|uniref:AB hydrolase-1 domain-containing protein n=1 Tax=Tetracentron sinense TaxID=13715 RepID=A0A835DDF6_TETSI|nr:hypothetical protein HHK36_013545 [Tetracentron sinense]